MSKHLITTLIILVIGVGGWFWFTANYAKVDKGEVWVGLKGEAKNKKFYVATHFLKEKGLNLSAKRGKVRPKEIDTNKTIFISYQQKNMLDSTVVELLDWVDKGGHLVIKTSLESSFASYIGAKEVSDDENHKIIYLDELNIKISSLFETYDSMNIEMEDSKFKHIISIKENKSSNSLVSSFNYGQGGVTFYYVRDKIFSDKIPFKLLKDVTDKALDLKIRKDKAFIMRKNNATFLYYLLTENTNSKDIIWFQSEEFPSILNIFKKYGLYVLFATLLFLLFWSIRAFRRFGSVINIEETSKVSLRKHIKAVGDFYYKNKDIDIHLLEISYDNLIEKLNKNKINLTEDKLQLLITWFLNRSATKFYF